MKHKEIDSYSLLVVIRKRTLSGFFLCGLIFACNSVGWAALVSELPESFSTLTITENSIGAGSPLVCSSGVPTNSVTFSPNPSSLSKKWIFHASGNYPLSWSGTNETQAWAVSGNQMYFHGANGPYDDGHAILSRDTFDKAKYVVATADIRAYCSNGSSGCWAGIAIINQESNYRGLYLATTPGGQASVNRLAPCNEQSSGQSVAANTWQTLTVEYHGPEGGRWSYYLNGARIQSTSAVTPAGFPGFVIGGIESSASGNTDVALTSNPRLGIYTNANFQNGYVEGGIRNVNVRVLAEMPIASATASSSYLPAYYAIDGDPNTAWVANTGGSQWIEVDLGTVRMIRKIRLLTEQSYTEHTVHQIYVGSSPAPGTLALTFSGVTSTAQWLDHTFVSSPPSGRYVRIVTPTSNSWRAWREIEVYQ